ncbi:hypothetical protein HMPREF3038_00389 [Akkermansia sp. KLE1797]|nr:hypothetical protein HMPREF3038_00389 [Akkermansia sp. KLE1797]KXU55017.1 hypothetical protein HMPREF3039_00742 [Akkermansia sp. KLE1798]KZA04351.1 hypothetical protein HMPREF1326_02019 [Akkermansia sp. KLE1605]
MTAILHGFRNIFPVNSGRSPALKNGVRQAGECRWSMPVPVHFQPPVPSWVTFCCRSSSERWRTAETPMFI